jgi:hypothetical protein
LHLLVGKRTLLLLVKEFKSFVVVLSVVRSYAPHYILVLIRRFVCHFNLKAVNLRQPSWNVAQYRVFINTNSVLGVRDKSKCYEEFFLAERFMRGARRNLPNFLEFLKLNSRPPEKGYSLLR